jgi:ribonuclease T2
MARWTALAAGFLLTLAVGPGGRAQDFDYWLVALSWTPSWCAAEGEGGEGQCDPRRDLGFTLHGLWPQYEEGWPEDCASAARDPSRRETAAMGDIMGSGGLAWYQWKKHGRCSGLGARDYFALSRRVYGGLELPRPAGGRATAEAIEAAFRTANPGLPEDGVIVTCRDRALQEVRVCLSRDLEPRTCGADVLADACRQPGPIEVPPIR